VNEPPKSVVTISGCSSGGKSTLLAGLRWRGFATIDEPGRRIVTEELKRGGTTLPGVDVLARSVSLPRSRYFPESKAYRTHRRNRKTTLMRQTNPRTDHHSRIEIYRIS